MYQIICVGQNNPFREMGKQGWKGVVTENQRRLIDAVKKGVLNGVFYNAEMYEFVKQELADILTPDVFEDVMTNTHTVEFGKFGTDIYNCRKFVESSLRIQANKEAISLLKKAGLIKVGSFINDVRYSDMTFSTCKIDEITETSILLVCTRKGDKNRYRIQFDGNDTRLLEKLVPEVRDQRVTAEKKTDGTVTFVINPMANHQREFVCQLALS